MIEKWVLTNRFPGRGGRPWLASAASPAQGTRRGSARRFTELSRETVALFGKEGLCRGRPEVPGSDRAGAAGPTPRYNLACALARLGKQSDALDALAQAVEKGFADAAHIRSDPDLASLRQDPRFESLAMKAAKAEEEAWKALPYDKGRDIPGVKTVEGNPDGGLRYRIRMSPEATKNKPHRLIIWLHPSGGSMNSTVEALAPRLVKQGWALLVFTQKHFMGWREDDARRLLRHTLPDVAQIEGLDAERPVLLGYSAGGQMALILVVRRPRRVRRVGAQRGLSRRWTGRGRRVRGMTLPEATRSRMFRFSCFPVARMAALRFGRRCSPRGRPPASP